MSKSDKSKYAATVQKLFSGARIDILFMKLYSEDDDIDVVVIDDSQYHSAEAVLQSTGWRRKNNRSKLRERDKDFYYKEQIPYCIHLHRAFSWNTIVYLDSRLLNKRAIRRQKICMPSHEDELLIIAAHSLFENQYITPEEVTHASYLLKKPLDYKYMKNHAKRFGWTSGFDMVYSALVESRSHIAIRVLVRAKLEKLISDISHRNSMNVLRGILNFFLIDWVWNYRLMLRKTRNA